MISRTCRSLNLSPVLFRYHVWIDGQNIHSLIGRRCERLALVSSPHTIKTCQTSASPGWIEIISSRCAAPSRRERHGVAKSGKNASVLRHPVHNNHHNHHIFQRPVSSPVLLSTVRILFLFLFLHLITASALQALFSKGPPRHRRIHVTNHVSENNRLKHRDQHAPRALPPHRLHLRYPVATSANPCPPPAGLDARRSVAQRVILERGQRQPGPRRRRYLRGAPRLPAAACLRHFPAPGIGSLAARRATRANANAGPSCQLRATHRPDNNKHSWPCASDSDNKGPLWSLHPGPLRNSKNARNSPLSPRHVLPLLSLLPLFAGACQARLG